jgi:putative ATP-binding cassette transporter
MFKLLVFFARSARSVRNSRSVLSAVFAAGIIGGAANTLAVIIVNYMIAHPRKTWRLILAFIGVCLVMGISKYLSQVWLIRFAARTIADLRGAISRQILASPLRYLEEIGSHRLLVAITEDVPAVTQALTQAPNLCINFVIVTGSMGYLAWLSWRLLLGVILCIGVGIGGYYLLEQRSRRWFQVAQTQGSFLFKNLQALLQGAKELQMHRKRREEFLSQGIEKRADMVAEYRIKGTRNYVIAETWGELTLFLLLGFVLLGNIGSQGSSPSVLTGYVLVFFYLMSPLQFIMNVLPTISQADVAIDRIDSMRLLLQSHQAEGLDAAPPVSHDFSEIELQGITHTYHHEKDGHEFTLGPVDLRIRCGEILFVTGGNGSGKTTLIKVLTGLYAPESGRVLVDGKPVSDSDPDNYRRLFSVVFSDCFLFDELLGMSEVDEAANSYLSLLQLDHKVTVKNGTLSTVELSQGQRKRLALLVAYLEDRPIYVFDEWAADQDPLFRDIFYLQLLPELKRKGKGVVVISHDDRYYNICDRIVKLDFGKMQMPVGVEREQTSQVASSLS